MSKDHFGTITRLLDLRLSSLEASLLVFDLGGLPIVTQAIPIDLARRLHLLGVILSFTKE